MKLLKTLISHQDVYAQQGCKGATKKHINPHTGISAFTKLFHAEKQENNF